MAGMNAGGAPFCFPPRPGLLFLAARRPKAGTRIPLPEDTMARSNRPGWPYKKDFQCHRCGNCCRGDGFVDLSAADIARAARLLGLDEEQFIDTYCIRTGDMIILRDQEDDLQSCIFLFEDGEGLAGCRIQEGKPDQCAAFPFGWRPRNVLQFCDGMRALEGLPPTKAAGKRSITHKGR